MKKAYEKLLVEVYDFQSEVIMSDDDVIFSVEEGVEDGGDY